MYALNRDAETLKQNAANSYQKQRSGRIEETGVYHATIDCAVWEEFNGWKKLVIYITDENEKTGVLEFPYENPQGERMFGADSLDALIVCGGVRSNLTEAPDTVMRWSRVMNAMNEDDVNSCPELKNKWYKFLIRKTMDAYEKRDTGEIKEYSTLQCAGIFQSKTDLSAVEIIDKITQPAAYFESIAGLDSYPIGYTKRHKHLMGGKVQQPRQNGYGQQQNAQLDDDSDLPF